MLESRLLETWKEELKKERRAYYQEQLDIYKELQELKSWVNTTTRNIISDTYTEIGYGVRDKVYETAWNKLQSLGINYEKELFIMTANNGTEYTVKYNGMELKNHFRFERITTYNIVNYYFVVKESNSLYELLEQASRGKDLNKLADKEIEVYIESLINRIEKKYGKVLTVKDSYLSNVESVIFECENGSCYLERILAGGYNIQRLHNRILVKEMK